ncbi:class I SAM-dependent methyltransferase [Actinomycetospora soli]|uniref:class I SAM-dependent methyltransferase n=1 Tax=Actinomycetospora soli TaxID=2893887 RepID=UPI001E4908EE|nr:methyltransferase domain-containing protein [Actinomycetospora soli]MCD2188057.1 methyltransferase domain-containing protein [Actinomycetospora soli]
MTEIRHFSTAFLRDPLHVAALFPSFPPLCRQAIAPLPETGDPVVLDLGAGTGSVTDEIQKRLRGRGRHIAVEMDEDMAEVLARRHPDVEVMCTDAHTAVEKLLAEGVRVDLSVSGLPWLATAPKDRSIFPLLARAAAPGGAVTQLAHAWIRFFPTAKQVQRNLEATFEEVVVSRTVWLNAPPAVVYVARRPRTS